MCSHLWNGNNNTYSYLIINGSTYKALSTVTGINKYCYSLSTQWSELPSFISCRWKQFHENFGTWIISIPTLITIPISIHVPTSLSIAIVIVQLHRQAINKHLRFNITMLIDTKAEKGWHISISQPSSITNPVVPPYFQICFL